MNLRQVFNSLEHVHLSGLSITNSGVGIGEIDYPLVLVSINEILTDLYTRFDLKTSEVILRLIKGQTEYTIHSDYADSNVNSTEPVRWVVDSVDNPFKDDISYILSVTTSTQEKLEVNKPNYCNSVFTPSTNTIQIPTEIAETVTGLSVIYNASPILVPVSTTLDVDTINIELPQAMFNALIFGVCKTIYSVKGGKDGYSKSNDYHQKYLNELNMLSDSGMFSNFTNERKSFSDGGWK